MDATTWLQINEWTCFTALFDLSAESTRFKLLHCCQSQTNQVTARVSWIDMLWLSNGFGFWNAMPRQRLNSHTRIVNIKFYATHRIDSQFRDSIPWMSMSSLISNLLATWNGFASCGWYAWWYCFTSDFIVKINAWVRTSQYEACLAKTKHNAQIMIRLCWKWKQMPNWNHTAFHSQTIVFTFASCVNGVTTSDAARVHILSMPNWNMNHANAFPIQAFYALRQPLTWLSFSALNPLLFTQWKLSHSWANGIVPVPAKCSTQVSCD